MGKVLITADLHIHPRRSDIRCVDDGLECLTWIYETANVNKCSYIIFAGDFLHDRFSLNSYAYSKASEIISDSPVKTIFLLGNHDMYYEENWSVHSLMPIKGIATVIDYPCTLDVEGYPIDFIPYTSSPSEHIQSFNSPSSLLVSHLPILDAILNAKYDIRSVEDDSKDKEILPATDFHKWKKVILGHYHYAQEIDDIVEYIGSPMQLSFGEAGHKKHIGIIDLKSLKTEYVENTISPRFHIVEQEKDLKKLNVGNSYVQMRTEYEIAKKFDLRTKLEKAGAREIEFVPPKKDVASQTIQALSKVINVINNTEKVIDEFVDNVEIPAGLDKAKLKLIGKQIVRSQR